jgi:hypothetical protein
MRNTGQRVFWLTVVFFGLIAALTFFVPGVSALAETAAPTTVYVDDDYDATSCAADAHTW